MLVVAHTLIRCGDAGGIMAKEKGAAGGKSVGVDDAMLRLTGAQLVRGTSEEVTRALASAGVKLRGFGARTFEPIKGRPRKDRVVVPEAIAESARSLRVWVQRTVEHAQEGGGR
jgi:hypothetical protein